MHFSSYIMNEWLIIYRYIPKCFHSWLFMTSISYSSGRVKSPREQDDLFIHDQQNMEMYFIWVISLLIRILSKTNPDEWLFLASKHQYGIVVSIYLISQCPMNSYNDLDRYTYMTVIFFIWQLFISDYAVTFYSFKLIFKVNWNKICK